MVLPLNHPVRSMDDHRLQNFLAQQVQRFGGKLEVEPNHWALFILPATDAADNAVAQELLATASFAHDAGASEDDAWMIYYVRTEHRPAAVFWLDDLHRIVSGQVRLLTPAQEALLNHVLTSDMPHRMARNIADLHTKGEISAGAIRHPQTVRALLDRLHAREPLFFSAFQILLESHLIDMLVLYRSLIDEDIRLENDLTLGAISQDPFYQKRQSAAAQIRNLLIKFQIINPLDQQKQTGATNPYASFTDTKFKGDEIIMRIMGVDMTASRRDFITAIRLMRKNMYLGAKAESMTTQAPWITDVTAHPLRLIKQQMDSNREISALVWLYMLERAADPDARA